MYLVVSRSPQNFTFVAIFTILICVGLWKTILCSKADSCNTVSPQFIRGGTGSVRCLSSKASSCSRVELAFEMSRIYRLTFLTLHDQRGTFRLYQSSTTTFVCQLYTLHTSATVQPSIRCIFIIPLKILHMKSVLKPSV